MRNPEQHFPRIVHGCDFTLYVTLVELDAGGNPHPLTLTDGWTVKLWRLAATDADRRLTPVEEFEKTYTIDPEAANRMVITVAADSLPLGLYALEAYNGTQRYATRTALAVVEWTEEGDHAATAAAIVVGTAEVKGGVSTYVLDWLNEAEWNEMKGSVSDIKAELDDKLSKSKGGTVKGVTIFSNHAEFKSRATLNSAYRAGVMFDPYPLEFITKEYADAQYLPWSSLQELIEATENGEPVNLNGYAAKSEFVVTELGGIIEDRNLIVVPESGYYVDPNESRPYFYRGKLYKKFINNDGDVVYEKVVEPGTEKDITPSASVVATYIIDGTAYVYDSKKRTLVSLGSNAKGYKVETENNLLVVEDEDGGEWVCGVTKRVAPATPTIAQTTRDVEVGSETVNAVFTITCATAGAETYYSAGKDSDPTKTGTKASKVEIAMSPNNDDKVSQTVRLASKLNGAWSAVSDSIDLVANFKVCQPKVFVLGTKYDDNRDVEIKCATQGASVKYTYGMNIDVPYTIGDKINFTDEVSVTAKATKTNYKDSDMSNEGVVTLNYPKTYIGDFNGTSITLDEKRALSKPLESDGLEVGTSYSFTNKNGGYIWICQTTPLNKDKLFFQAGDVIPIGFASAKEVDVETGSGTIKYYCYRSLEKQNAGVTTIYLKS